MRIEFTLPAGPIRGVVLSWQALALHGAAPTQWRLTGVVSDRIIH